MSPAPLNQHPLPSMSVLAASRQEMASRQTIQVVDLVSPNIILISIVRHTNPYI